MATTPDTDAGWRRVQRDTAALLLILFAVFGIAAVLLFVDWRATAIWVLVCVGAVGVILGLEQ